ncbi:hypothetical protein NP233_g3151 [Leucocoprinus birnbaumii]|uniref:Uncharacterized protein n=1 Tax=Leucocoprinus birnbaumii TaxID=56174 RepID=A0AAD5VXP1_9AGAR|nr:hypothetical protein NP233_g3151 [Leucocoprinus birnbaumii]
MASIVSLPSTATNSVVFPPPPPTTNALTLEQRAQLHTDIVGILGPVHISLPSRKEAPSPVLSESSVDSFSSRSSSSCSFYPTHPYAACASLEHKPSTSSLSLHARQNSLCKRPSSAGRVSDHFESSKSRAPLLRLAVTPPSPTSSTSSCSSSSSPTSARSASIDSHNRSISLDDTASTTTHSASDMKFTLRPTRHATSVRGDDSMMEPSFKVPSPSSIRRQKMDRIRKMLGDDVPVHLVFPDQKLPEAEPPKEPEVHFADEVLHPSSSISPVAVAGTAIPRPKKVVSGKIVGARDSMGTFTPHRAKRQEKQKLDSKPLTPLPPSPPIVIPASSIPKDPSQRQLRVIVECPEEHGASSFEGFGFGSSAVKKSSQVVVHSSWHVRDGTVATEVGNELDANKVWSTRKGYTGWDRSIIVSKSEQERKKAMSYRKPPPPVDF